MKTLVVVAIIIADTTYSNLEMFVFLVVIVITILNCKKKDRK